MLDGEKGSGKTWICLKLADSASKNEDFGIWKAYDHEFCVPSGAKVLYLDGEWSPIDLKERCDELSGRR